MKAITVKPLPATNTKPFRLKAFAEDGRGGLSVTVSWEEASGDGGNRTQGETYLYAANKLKEKMNWKGALLGGGTKDGFVFVFAETPIR